MSEKTPNQPVNQTQAPEGAQETQTIRIKKPVRDIKMIKVSKHTYNVIRSFINSSSKDIYPWNTGVKVNNRVVFMKPGKWNLIIYLGSHDGEKIIAELVSRGDVLQLSFKKLWIDSYDFDITDLMTLISTAIIPNDYVPYAEPVLLIDVVEKLREYIDF